MNKDDGRRDDGLMESTSYITLGCDPEFFFKDSDSNVVSSDRVLSSKKINKNGNIVIIDGVQAELNPTSSSCRQSLALNISSCFKIVNEELLKSTEKCSVSFDPLVTLKDEDMKKIKKETLNLGCDPSKNSYIETPDKIGKIDVDPFTYNARSAGGHIHLGFYNDKKQLGFLKDYNRLVPVLDIVVGNTCVMLDTGKAQAKRREVYGKAGEYREKEYGIEYRVLSNFWLRNYSVMSFVFSLSRLAVSIVGSSNKTYNDNNYLKRTKIDFYEELMKLVDIEDVKKAINENDSKLAKENFKKIEPFLLKIIPSLSYGRYPFEASLIHLFHHFVDKGLDYWFKEDPFQHWIKLDLAKPKDLGWETFIDKVVRSDFISKRNIENRLFDFLNKEVALNKS